MCTSPTALYTLSLHDALPILPVGVMDERTPREGTPPDLVIVDIRGDASSSMGSIERLRAAAPGAAIFVDRKSTRLNSSHRCISYAVFCLKKKKKAQEQER